VVIVSFVLYIGFRVPVSGTNKVVIPVLTKGSICFLERNLLRVPVRLFDPLHFLHLIEVNDRTGVIGNCKIRIFFTRLKLITHKDVRYSNTLLLTLNNRIYFRDHPFPGSGSGHSGYPGTSRPSEHHLPQVRAAVVTTNDTSRLGLFLSTTDLEKGGGNTVVSNPRPSH